MTVLPPRFEDKSLYKIVFLLHRKKPLQHSLVQHDPKTHIMVDMAAVRLQHFIDLFLWSHSH